MARAERLAHLVGEDVDQPVDDGPPSYASPASAQTRRKISWNCSREA
jgi:hypothetical protein